MNKGRILIRKASSAFSMVELILVIVVIGLALIPMLSAFSSFHKNTRASMEEVISTNFASELMEALQALPFDHLKFMDADLIFDAGNFTPDPFEIAVANGNCPGLSTKILPPEFQIHLKVDSYPVSGVLISDAKLMQLHVTVKWGARDREIQLKTLRGRY